MSTLVGWKQVSLQRYIIVMGNDLLVLGDSTALWSRCDIRLISKIGGVQTDRQNLLFIIINKKKLFVLHLMKFSQLQI